MGINLQISSFYLNKIYGFRNLKKIEIIFYQSTAQLKQAKI